MKKLFTTDTKYLNSDLALLVGRVAFAVLMLSHGLPKMQMLFSGDPIQFPSVFGISSQVSLALTLFLQKYFVLFLFWLASQQDLLQCH